MQTFKITLIEYIKKKTLHVWNVAEKYFWVYELKIFHSIHLPRKIERKKQKKSSYSCILFLIIYDCTVNQFIINSFYKWQVHLYAMEK